MVRKKVLPLLGEEVRTTQHVRLRDKKQGPILVVWPYLASVELSDDPPKHAIASNGTFGTTIVMCVVGPLPFFRLGAFEHGNLYVSQKNRYVDGKSAYSLENPGNVCTDHPRLIVGLT